MELVSQISNLCGPDPPTSRTDRRTTCNLNTALCSKVHRAVKTNRSSHKSVDALTLLPLSFTVAVELAAAALRRNFSTRFMVDVVSIV